MKKSTMKMGKMGMSDVNDCKYFNIECGGCSKLYIGCNFMIRDQSDLGCGGCCYEQEEREEDDMYGKS